MFSRLLASVALSTLALTGPAGSQGVFEGGLGEIDPWGAGYISRGEGAFPTSLWTGSRAEELIPLLRRTAMGRVDRILMTPAEHDLLRRALLSPAEKPQGSADGLLEERIRLLRALGEIEAAIDLMRKSGDEEMRRDAERLTTDMALARGDVASACSGAERSATDDPYFMKLRAVCFAMAGDDPGVELAVELAAGAGVDDEWLFAALLTTIVDTPNKPPARLRDGLSITASMAAELKAPSDAMEGVEPHIALALAQRDGLPAEWRLLAAGISAEAGLADPDAVRAAFRKLEADPEYNPGSSLERAMQLLNEPTASATERARAFSDALRSAAGRPERFASVSRVLAPGIERLPRNAEIAPRALVFARAALARGDVNGAGRWAGATEFEGGPTIDAFERALTEGLVLLARSRIEPASVKAVTEALLAEAKTTQQKATVARLFVLLSELGATPGPEARELIASAGRSSNARPSDDGEVLRLSTLTETDLSAEMILRVIKFTNGNPERLSTRDAAAIVRLLKGAGLDEDARAFALEAMKYWNP